MRRTLLTIFNVFLAVKNQSGNYGIQLRLARVEFKVFVPVSTLLSDLSQLA